MNPLAGLEEQLAKLPGVGPKTAQRLAFFFLSLPHKSVEEFATTLQDTHKKIRYCKECYNISFEDQCFICQNTARNRKQICVVEEPKDIFSLERTKEYKGLYHVLGGLISPLDGIDPELIRIKELLERLKELPTEEIIFAINPTVEGEATIMYLEHVLKPVKIKMTKLAYGLPVGSNIDYADELTLQRAFDGRTDVL